MKENRRILTKVTKWGCEKIQYCSVLENTFNGRRKIFKIDMSTGTMHGSKCREIYKKSQRCIQETAKFMLSI